MYFEFKPKDVTTEVMLRNHSDLNERYMAEVLQRQLHAISQENYCLHPDD